MPELEIALDKEDLLYLYIVSLYIEKEAYLKWVKSLKLARFLPESLMN